MNYKITKFEGTSKALHICIISFDNPVSIDHWFAEEERTTNQSIKETIEGLVAKLEIINDEYVAPELFVDKLEEAQAIELDTKKIALLKKNIISMRVIPVEEPIVEEPIL